MPRPRTADDGSGAVLVGYGSKGGHATTRRRRPAVAPDGSSDAPGTAAAEAGSAPRHRGAVPHRCRPHPRAR